MTLQLWQDLLLCSTLINYAALLLWLLFFAFARDWLHELHGRWFRLTEERFDAIHYAGMALYKLAILLFNLAPYLALRIVA